MATPPSSSAAPAPPAAPTGPTACPKCGAAVPAGAKFCNACGASLAAAPAAGAPPVDIRQTVEGDRGVLKRLQLLVPGFRGYREGEDIRAADSLLRRQVADKVHNARLTIENSRAALTNGGQFQTLNDLAPVIADLMRIEGSIRHAEQGYTGISPAVRANPPQLDRLYEYDYGFAIAADQLNAAIAPLPTLAAGAAASGRDALAALITTVRGLVAQLDTAFKARLQAVEGIRVS
ncbi:MAG TPA: zinc ribbon domain-containing protein [Thermoplasmata archaeon]|nr:zinc ribbon domain-containing protein [Thermoplasmata archaeon]